MSAMLSRVDRSRLRELRDQATYHSRAIVAIEDRIAKLLNVRRGVGEQSYFDHITDFVSGIGTVNELVVRIRTMQARDGTPT